ncbi:uncharacterized protein EI90DRAFT_3145409 [Cantharellus anzutake]|uniref:uncharacterized protein n=1 Tax=Cantharellus anzutake TaxID=1750568 RepID=UPI001905DB86|nr:uncharacterized protein EI90DRAFT_3145409 [Cantharellus anzutake]KAF8332813.1 hypothetical protein EI90DRAFT_3145409 [Cantharellus anzutake]
MKRLFSSSAGRALAHRRPYPPRTHTCGGLGPEHDGEQVILTGWLTSIRKISKSMAFFSLKDSFGTTQLLSNVPLESTLLIQGRVKTRPQQAQRDKETGGVEVILDDVTVLNAAERELPFYPSDLQNLANENLRSRYRYLDLRRDYLSQNLRTRSQVANIIRSHLADSGFTEIETPMLLRSSPEGAREFLVPARLPASASPTNGASSATIGPHFYALSQSPQQPKQLLIISGGVDRYYQFARCFRDEDGRKDRQPEFTQVDMEMAWVSWGDHNGQHQDGWRIGGREVKDTVEGIIRQVWREVKGMELDRNFHVLTYEEAMAKYGSDKPDTRFGCLIQNAAPLLPEPVAGLLDASDKVLECIIIRGSQQSSAMTEVAFSKAASEASEVALGLNDCQAERIMIASENQHNWWKGSNLLCHAVTGVGDVNHGFDRPDTLASLQPGDILFLALREKRLEGGSTLLGRTRLRLADEAAKLGASQPYGIRYSPPHEPNFLWITEFPLFTRADADKDAFLGHGRWSSSHHPFTAPMWEDAEGLLDGTINPANVRGQHYDLVLNGNEIGGGSVRIHDAELQEYVFKQVLQLSREEREPFEPLVHALRCGAPPHGGIALGFDRLMTILCNTSSIRDVIAFPKTAGGTDPLFKSPSSVGDEVLKAYGIQERR